MTAPDLQALRIKAETGDAPAALALAQALFRDRRIDEGMDWLRRAAAAGHPMAQVMLGARLLAVDASAEAWSEGVPLLFAGRDAGIADASTMLAVLAALGAGVKQSWSGAFDLLAEGAERGSGRGRAQLLALAREGGVDGVGDEAAADWSALRAGLDPEPWLAPPPFERLSASPHIAVSRGFLSPGVCAWLIGRARGRAGPAKVFDPETGGGRVDFVRSNSAFQFNAIEADVLIALVRARIAAALGADTARLEPSQVLHYRVGQTFAPHVDFLDEAQPGLAKDVAARGQRSDTVLIYLNDDYEGGETHFLDLDLRFKGRPGDVLWFRNLGAAGRPDRRTTHAGLPPTAGEKWLFSQWVRDRAPTTAAS